jgi:formate/nitrite transporter FocA (FNT family)
MDRACHGLLRALVSTGGWQDLLFSLVYPIGFIAVIIGRAQLFTENTSYPVVLVLDEHRFLLRTLRLWPVFFAANLCGAWFFQFS